MFNTYNDEFYGSPRNFDEGFTHQEMISHSHRRNNRVLFDVENKDFVYNRPEYCPSCMSKPPDKQIMFPVYDENMTPYTLPQQQNQKSSSPILPNLYEEHTPLEIVEKEQQHYPPRYMFNNNEVFYDGYPEREPRYGMNHFIERESDRMNQIYQVVNTNPNSRLRAFVEQNNLYRGTTTSRGSFDGTSTPTRMSMDNGTPSRNSFDGGQYNRYLSNRSRQLFDKEQLKNDIEELNKDNIEWSNCEMKSDVESGNEQEQPENNYEGLMDIKKTIKKDYNKKKWRKMTQELFNQILDFEKKNPNIKQCEIEKIFLVNRSTYWRWKKRLLS